jgi:hypothetical protein
MNRLWISNLPQERQAAGLTAQLVWNESFQDLEAFHDRRRRKTKTSDP